LPEDFFAEVDRVIKRSTAMKTIVIGVMPQERIRARAIAIAKGEYKPKPGEHKIWFTSMESVAEVLSDRNRALLKVVRESNPDSLAVLAKTPGRQPGSVANLEDDVALRAGGPATRKDPRQAGREGDRVSDPGSRLRSCARLFRSRVTAACRDGTVACHT
jgi:predicted transcriptional regulator